MRYNCLFILLIACNADSICDIGYFWQLSDIHLDPDYVAHSCNNRFNDRRCDSSPILARSAILNATQKFLPNRTADFVIWSGDNGAHNIKSSEQLLHSIRLLSAEIKHAFPTDQVYVLPVLGNHDIYPSDQMRPTQHDQTRQAWCHHLAVDTKLWGPWIHGRSSAMAVDTVLLPRSPLPVANFSLGCYFSHLIRQSPSSLPLLLISLNGLLWYTGNPFAGNAGSDPLGQLHWLNESFQWARQTGSKVILVSHFPPGASENSPKKFKFLRSAINAAFVQLLHQYADVLMVGLFGHTHVDSFRVLHDTDGKPLASLLIAPSCSPFRLPGLGSPNPRIRLYRYKRSTGLLLDYLQLYVDLDHRNNTNQAQPFWTVEYNSTEAYGNTFLSDLSPHSLSKLLDGLEVDSSIWAKYWNHELGYGPRDGNRSCGEVKSICHCHHACAMRYLSIPALDTCLNSCSTRSYHVAPSLQSASYRGIESGNESLIATEVPSTVATTNGDLVTDDRSSLPIVIGVIVLFLAILVGVVFIVNREICRKRGHYNRRLFGVGGLLMPNSLIGASTSDVRNQDRRLGGSSCTKLRTDFSPSEENGSTNVRSNRASGGIIPYISIHRPIPSGSAQVTDDDELLAIEDEFGDVSIERPNGFVRSSRDGTDNNPQKLCNLGNRHSQSEVHMVLSRFFQDLSSNPFGRPFRQALGRVSDQGSVITGESSSNVTGKLPAWNFDCPAEDYYADDEEFGYDDDEHAPLDSPGRRINRQLISEATASTASSNSVLLTTGETYNPEQNSLLLNEAYSTHNCADGSSKCIPKGSLRSTHDRHPMQILGSSVGPKNVECIGSYFTPTLIRSQSVTLALNSASLPPGHSIDTEKQQDQRLYNGNPIS